MKTWIRKWLGIDDLATSKQLAAVLGVIREASEASILRHDTLREELIKAMPMLATLADDAYGARVMLQDQVIEKLESIHTKVHEQEPPPKPKVPLAPLVRPKHSLAIRRAQAEQESLKPVAHRDRVVANDARAMEGTV